MKYNPTEGVNLFGGKSPTELNKPSTLKKLIQNVSYLFEVLVNVNPKLTQSKKTELRNQYIDNEKEIDLLHQRINRLQNENSSMIQQLWNDSKRVENKNIFYGFLQRLSLSNRNILKSFGLLSVEDETNIDSYRSGEFRERDGMRHIDEKYSHSNFGKIG